MSTTKIVQPATHVIEISQRRHPHAPIKDHGHLLEAY